MVFGYRYRFGIFARFRIQKRDLVFFLLLFTTYADLSPVPSRVPREVVMATVDSRGYVLSHMCGSKKKEGPP